jgi:hypothetical protein
MDGASCLRGRTKYQPSPWASQTWAKRSSRRTVCTDLDSPIVGGAGRSLLKCLKGFECSHRASNAILSRSTATARCRTAASVESGNWYLPHPMLAFWVEEFIGECAALPAGAHDDWVDAWSQGAKRLLTIKPKPAPRPVPGTPLPERTIVDDMRETTLALCLLHRVRHSL